MKKLQSFDQAWSALKDKHHFECNKTVLNYFENKLLPTFKSHSSIWVLKGAGIENPELGITNNPSESINANLHALQNWSRCLWMLFVFLYSIWVISITVRSREVFINLVTGVFVANSFLCRETRHWCLLCQK